MDVTNCMLTRPNETIEIVRSDVFDSVNPNQCPVIDYRS